MHLTLKQLSYFAEIAQAENMSQAAERLHVSPTALSLQVKALEQDLGVTLFQRHSRGMVLTEAGADLYGRAREILALVSDAETSLRGGSTAEPLRIGLLPSAARLFGVEAMLAAQDLLGGRKVHIVTDWANELNSALRAGELDFAVSRGISTDGQFATLDLVEEQLIFATAAAQARPGGRVSFAEALASDLALSGAQTRFTQIVLRKAAELGLTVNAVHQFHSLEVMRGIIVRGVGTAITSLGSVDEEVRHGEIAVHRIDGVSLTDVLSLAAPHAVWREGVTSGLVAYLADTVIARCLEIGGTYRRLQPAAALRPRAAAGGA